jgi:ATP-binding cassette, subfamily B, multidrug efflux pump
MNGAQTGIEPGPARHAPRPPHAVVGSQINTEEQIFAAFDGKILRRFWAFISPYRRQLVLAVLAVLAFTASQIAIPLILRTVIDHALVDDARDERLLTLGVLVFLGIVTLNFFANLVQ